MIHQKMVVLAIAIGRKRGRKSTNPIYTSKDVSDICNAVKHGLTGSIPDLEKMVERVICVKAKTPSAPFNPARFRVKNGQEEKLMASIWAAIPEEMFDPDQMIAREMDSLEGMRLDEVLQELLPVRCDIALEELQVPEGTNLANKRMELVTKLRTMKLDELGTKFGEEIGKFEKAVFVFRKIAGSDTEILASIADRLQEKGKTVIGPREMPALREFLGVDRTKPLLQVILTGSHGNGKVSHRLFIGWREQTVCLYGSVMTELLK
jgi:hypothetical protein